MSREKRLTVARYAVRRRWLTARKWLASFRHVPHSRSVWCGDKFCPYGIEAVR